MKIRLRLAGYNDTLEIIVPNTWKVEDLLHLLNIHESSIIIRINRTIMTEDHPLKEGDFVEIYPLGAQFSPKLINLLKVLEARIEKSNTLERRTTFNDTNRGCSFCKEEETIIRYKYIIGGVIHSYKLCKKCFLNNVENKVLRLINWYNVVQSNDSILVALSGEKDSVLTLYFLKKYLDEEGEDFTLHALTVNCGLGEYDKRRIQYARKLCKMLNVQHEVISIEEHYEWGLKKIFEKRKKELTNSDLTICDVCAIMRSRLIYDFAYKEGYNKIAEGYNLEERITSSLVAHVYGDHLMQTFVGEPIIPGRYYCFNIKRVRILMNLSSKEVGLYIFIKNIPTLFRYEYQCPFYTFRARGIHKYAGFINEAFPGITYLLKRRTERNNYSRLKKYVKTCEKCNVTFLSLLKRKICDICYIKETLKLD